MAYFGGPLVDDDLRDTSQLVQMFTVGDRGENGELDVTPAFDKSNPES